ncbi:hypothetical protein TSUD_305550 [Trifolium subterraneum]|uniref:Uncharacterized protein n=1 Tax=Trifolium subterraneum TaxID=3900 RepID=A0A2Z6LXN6_TRISU|nr:hypothetical protein TSUD_305550 [Trifolium subterraneum]
MPPFNMVNDFRLEKPLLVTLHYLLSFTELKEEESSLLQERIVLEKEIATKNANFEVMRNTNASLKRMKLGFGSKSHNNPSSTSVKLEGTVAGQPHQRIVASEVLMRATQDDTRSQALESRPNKIESTGERLLEQSSL